VDENSVEMSVAGINQYFKVYLVNLQFGCSQYFSEAVSDKYKWIIDPFHVDSPQNYDVSLLEKTILTL
jgi:hypothetical protein